MDGDDPIIGCGMSDPSLPPSAAAPPDKLSLLAIAHYIESQAVKPDGVQIQLDTVECETIVSVLRAASREGGSSPDVESGRPGEWERAVRELGDLKEAILAATGYRDPSVGRMLTTDQIVERVTRASRERAAALPPTEGTKIPTDPHPSSNPHLDGWLPVEVDVAEVLNRQNRDRVDWYEIESMCRYILRVKAFRPMWAKRIAQWVAVEEAGLRAAPQQEKRTP